MAGVAGEEGLEGGEEGHKEGSVSLVGEVMEEGGKVRG